MKVLKTVSVALVLWITNELAYCEITCEKDYYIVNDNGREYCLMCNQCPEGQGLSPACGSKLNHPPAIECFSCVPGKTYSTDHGPSSCKNCHICSSKENVTKKCTAIENTICSNTCEKGYYYENATHGCLPCSDCCGDGNDIIITECVEHGMLLSKQCTIHNAQRCKKELSTIFTIPGTPYPVTTSSSSKGNDTGMIIGFSVGGTFIAVVIVIMLMRCWRKKRKHKRTRHIVDEERDEHVDNNAVNHLLEHNYCNIGHMSFQVKKDKGSENQISEGQTISLLLEYVYENGEGQQNKNCFTDNSYLEWKKDDSSIANNNYQNNSKEYKIGDVKVGDSGRYYCQIKCNKHATCEDSDAIIIHVLPGQGKTYKLFDDLDLDIVQKISSLTPNNPGIGNWKNLGNEYKMPPHILNALDPNQAAGAVLEYIKAANPDLTVYDFCEVMKKIKQNKVVKLLKNNLTTETDMTYRPDSGIYDELPSDAYDQQHQVKLPLKSDDSSTVAASIESSHLVCPALQQINLSYIHSREGSRQGSHEDLLCSIPGSQNPKSKESQASRGKKFKIPLGRKQSKDSKKSIDVNDDANGFEEDETSDKEKKPKLGRQISKDSQKSGTESEGGERERKRSRSSSINSIKDAARQVLKQQSSFEHYSKLDHHKEESDEGL